MHELSDEALAAIGRVLQHLPQQTELPLIVLKGHLLIEQQLRDIIRRRAPPSEVAKIDRLSFSALTRLARAYLHAEHYQWGDEVWEMIDVLNALRNELAHQLASPKVQTLAARLVQSQHLQRLPFRPPDPPIEEDVKHAIALLAGFLTTFLE